MSKWLFQKVALEMLMHTHHEMPFATLTLQSAIFKMQLQKNWISCRAVEKEELAVVTTTAIANTSPMISLAHISWVWQQLNNQPILAFRLEGNVLSKCVHFPELEKWQKLMKINWTKGKLPQSFGMLPWTPLTAVSKTMPALLWAPPRS